jgi:hypothetical protein
MGNRGGRLHDPATREPASRRFASRRWIICLTCFKGRRREVWGEGYTELFFLDEPTALAAGHRPCFECRREAANAFRQAFPREADAAPPDADAIDRRLHAERLAAVRPRLSPAEAERLPDGTMVALDGIPAARRDGVFLRWSFAGHRGPSRLSDAATIDLLTPPSTVAALRAGYRPDWRD